MWVVYLCNMRREFHNLKQRQMSVTEYLREFTRLSKYASRDVSHRGREVP